MATTNGRLVQISPSIFTWELDGGIRKDVCISEIIYVCGNRYKFYFQLFKINVFYHTLHLLNPQVDFLKMDIEFLLNFCGIKEDPVTLKNYKIVSYDHLVLGIYGAKISEITFTFSNFQDLINPGTETLQFYNTTDTCEIIVPLSQSTFIWKLGSYDTDVLMQSKKMHLAGNKYVFQFRLCKINENGYILHLKNPELVFLKLDMHITIKISNVTTERIVENYEVKSYDQYVLHISPARYISEITVVFSNVEEFDNVPLTTRNLDYNMLNTSGVIEQVSTLTFNWKLDSENRKDVNTSKKMYVCKYVFYFRLFKMRKAFYTLHLINPEIVFVKLDMHVIVKFQETSTHYTLKHHEVKSYDQFIIGISQAKDISKITFRFSNAQDLKKPGNLRGNAIGVTEESENIERKDLKHPNGLSKLSEDLTSALLSEEDSDIIINVGDKTYPAHKLILRNRSTVFRAMLEHDMTEKNEDCIDVVDCDPIIFRNFLQYLYSGKADISNENVFELYYASDKYHVSLLKIDCVDYIVYNLSIDIICDVIALATKHSESNLLKKAVAFFMENAEEIFVTVRWQDFFMANPIQANELIIKSFKSDSRKQKPASHKQK